ncbi:MAG: aspartyl-tRNA(Asn)/glutamyl-tRNA(Gln) amidotransferase subunit A [Alphaproteobacteria bacterium]|jgi:aspartyl-tRNA(Asn)/glutamyl-tRNA(Gln) amidotransferase subunit A
MELYELSLKESAEKIKNKEISSMELTKSLLDRIETRNAEINAYVTIDREKALKMAEASDKRVKEGNPRLIEGVPLGIKDLFCTKGVRTTACSHILDGFIPPYESTVTENLWSAGGVLLGKTNMDEFAMGSSNETSYYGAVKNPWNLECTPGGSSGGSAAAVADYQCAASTGSDTGGSIRQPASFTGTVGIKPTYGRCSRYGMIAFASSLDQAGAFARNVEDAALMLRSMSGYDEKDSTSADRPIENYDNKLAEFDIKGLKIGLPKEYFVDELNLEVRAIIDKAIKNFEDQGAEVVEISLPYTKYAVPAYYIIAPAEAAANLSRYDGMRYGLRVEGENLQDTYMKTRTEGFGPEVQRRIMIGNYTLSSGYYDAYYTKAQRVRALITKDFEEAFEKVDIIITPTTPTPAFKLGGKVEDPIQMYLNDIFTVATNLAGLPGLSVPAGTMTYEGSTLPVGVQIIGPAFSERKMLRAAYAHEQMTKFNVLSAQG